MLVKDVVYVYKRLKDRPDNNNTNERIPKYKQLITAFKNLSKSHIVFFDPIFLIQLIDLAGKKDFPFLYNFLVMK